MAISRSSVLERQWPSANANATASIERSPATERGNVLACRHRIIAVGLVEEVRKVLAAAGKLKGPAGNEAKPIVDLQCVVERGVVEHSPLAHYVVDVGHVPAERGEHRLDQESLSARFGTRY